MSEGTSSNALTHDAVRRVATLSRLALDDTTIGAYAEQLSATLGYIERLRELDLEGVEPLTNPMDATNRLGADEPGETLDTEALMKMAPAKAPPFVRVPKVLGEGGGA